MYDAKSQRIKWKRKNTQGCGMGKRKEEYIKEGAIQEIIQKLESQENKVGNKDNHTLYISQLSLFLS